VFFKGSEELLLCLYSTHALTKKLFIYLFLIGFPEVDTLFGSYFESLIEKLDLWAM
jgi:hypothetical protein